MRRAVVLQATHQAGHQYRVKDYANEPLVDRARLDVDQPLGGVAATKHDVGPIAIALKMLKGYGTKNLLPRAKSVQWKWDWYQVGCSLKMYEYEREGRQITSDVVDKMMTREALLWKSVRPSIRRSHKAIITQVTQALRAVKEARLDDHLGFRVVEKTSDLREINRCFKHGQGVFADGDIPQGAVVGLVPGMWYESRHKVTRLWPDDSEGNPVKFSPYIHFRRSRLDHSILDADLARYPGDFGENANDDELKKAFHHYELQCATFMDMHRTTTNDKVKKLWFEVWMPLFWRLWHRWSPNADRVPYLPNHKWAPRHGCPPVIGKRWDHGFSRLRHLNHCGAERDANVLYVPISIPVEFPADLLPYVPNRLDPFPRYGAPNHDATIPTSGPGRDKMYADCIIRNHRDFGAAWDGTHESQFLYMAPAMAVIAIRPIKSGEELLVNYRFNPHLAVRKEYPLWYERHPEYMYVEDYLHNNLYAPGTTFFKRAVGIFDQRVTVADAWRDVRLFDTDIMAGILRLLGKWKKSK